MEPGNSRLSIWIERFIIFLIVALLYQLCAPIFRAEQDEFRAVHTSGYFYQ